MKTINKIAIFALLLASSSCKWDLSLPSQGGDLENPDAYSLKGLLVTAYNTMTVEVRGMMEESYWGGLGACDTDEAYNTGASVSSTSYEFYNMHNITSMVDHVSGTITPWRSSYRIIECCNIIIDAAPGVQMDEREKADLVGQAKVLRAFAFYYLTTNHGAVPLKIVPSHKMGLDVQLPRTPQKEVLQYVLNDVRSAIRQLSTMSEVKTTARITRSAAEALSLRIALYMASHPEIDDVQKYDSVAVWGKELISSGTHQLNTALRSGAKSDETAYSNLFVANMRNDASWSPSSTHGEGIWNCVFHVKSATSGEYANLGYIASQRLGSRMGITCKISSAADIASTPIGYCNSQYKPLNSLYQKYEAGDLRRDWNIATFEYKDNSWKRYDYAIVTPPTAIVNGTPSKLAKITPAINGGKLVSLILDQGGAGYKDGNYVQVEFAVDGYRIDWNANKVTAGKIKADVTVSGGVITGLSNCVVTSAGANFANVYDRGIGKWRREYEENVPPQRHRDFTSCNFPVIRYADVLLMTAEAALYKSGAAGASIGDGLNYVNQIRQRAGLGSIGTYDIKYIQDERSRELCFEGVRRTDLLRWSKKDGSGRGNGSYSYLDAVEYVQSFPTTAQINYAINLLKSNYTKFSVMPIPYSEISKAPNTLIQNEGW